MEELARLEERARDVINDIDTVLRSHFEVTTDDLIAMLYRDAPE